jgi:hypothetical protein
MRLHPSFSKPHHTWQLTILDGIQTIYMISRVSVCCLPLYCQICALNSSTTIESRKFRIPSDLRRQPGYRPVSSKVGDHLRILLGVVVHSFLLPIDVGQKLMAVTSTWRPVVSCLPALRELPSTRMIHSFTLDHTAPSFRRAGLMSLIRTG